MARAITGSDRGIDNDPRATVRSRHPPGLLFRPAREDATRGGLRFPPDTGRSIAGGFAGAGCPDRADVDRPARRRGGLRSRRIRSRPADPRAAPAAASGAPAGDSGYARRRPRRRPRRSRRGGGFTLARTVRVAVTDNRTSTVAFAQPTSAVHRAAARALADGAARAG